MLIRIVLQAQVVLLVILVVAIFDFIIGCLVGPQSDEVKAKGFMGFDGNNSRLVYQANLLKHCFSQCNVGKYVPRLPSIWWS